MQTKKINSNAIYLLITILLGLGLGYFIYTNFFTSKTEEPTFSAVEKTKYDNIRVYTQENKLNEDRSLLHISYPISENDDINTVIEGISSSFISEFERVANEQEEFYQNNKKDTGQEAVSSRAEYVQHFDVSFATNRYLLFHIYQYRSTGGTGSDDVISLFFNRQSGKQLSLAYLFSSDNYLEILAKKSRDILAEKSLEGVSISEFENEKHHQEWVEMRNKQIEEGTVPKIENFNSFEISEENDLVIIFDKYQVGPGSDGIVSIQIPLDDLAAILSEEMKDLFNIVEEDRQEEEKEEIPKLEESELDLEVDKDSGNKKINCLVDKCVALTFDDGPSIYTDELLDILKENEVKATFFVLGRSAKIQGDTILRMVSEGHDVGNHSFDHKDLRSLDEEGLAFQIKETNNLISSLSDYEVKLLRPPYGAYNEELLAKLDMPLILWSIDPEDWKDRDRDIVLARMSEARAGDIILAHDIYPTTVGAISELITSLKARGLKFVSISDLVGEENLKAGKIIRNQTIIL